MKFLSLLLTAADPGVEMSVDRMKADLVALSTREMNGRVALEPGAKLAAFPFETVTIAWLPDASYSTPIPSFSRLDFVENTTKFQHFLKVEFQQRLPWAKSIADCQYLLWII